VSKTAFSSRRLNRRATGSVLAHLELGHACALGVDPAEAKAAYHALERRTDPDTPILIAAKSEYSNIR
jgi:hypothetical protein